MHEQNESLKPRNPRAFNAYRQGLTGQIHILTEKDQLAYEKHCAGIRESLSPQTPLEASIVQSIADDRWRLHRAASFEDTLFAVEMSGPDEVTTGNEEVDAAFAMARAWLAKGKSIELISLYETRIHRNLEKNMAELRRLKAEREAALQQALEEAETDAEIARHKGEAYQVAEPVTRRQFVFSKQEIAARVAFIERRKRATCELVDLRCAAIDAARAA
jgi:hypothetical protein